MGWWLYNIVFAVGWSLLLPRYLFRMWKRGGYRSGFMERVGRYGDDAAARVGEPGRIWIHAVSVGEMYVALLFMDEIRKRVPGVRFVVSTNTSTGRRIGLERIRSPDMVIYPPVDLPWTVNRVLRLIRPSCLLLVECEFWPNLIRLAADSGVPVMLVNGRLSDSSYRGYRRLRFVFRLAMRRMKLMLVQGAAEQQRLIEIGADPARVKVAGSAKYDGLTRDAAAEARVRDVLEAAGLHGDGRKLIVAGSTWDGEEAALSRILLKLRERHDGLGLVLVPRHVERSGDVGRMLSNAGLRWVRRSAVGANGGKADVLLVDVTGELRHYYAFGDAVFVGKSLTQTGGQNIIEAGCAGAPVVVGPHMENFAAIARDFLDAKAMLQVQDESGLLEAMDRLLSDRSFAHAMGNRAKTLVEASAGSVGRSVDDILASVRFVTVPTGSGRT
ncbi:MAG: 3-deoxy-D-manno-octulosonic acid transferase [Lentisphaerae bacterium]|nr:3-deoxy-D-manno-octulosonic acid transferase [Lentisphaerota bacterium]